MEEMADLGTHRHKFKTKWYLYLYFHKSNCRCCLPLVKVCMEHTFLQRFLNQAFEWKIQWWLCSSSVLISNFFLILRFWDSGSHTWCATEVFYLRGCAEQSGSFVGFCGFVGNCLIAGQGFLKYCCFPHTHTHFCFPESKTPLGGRGFFGKKACNVLF